MDGDLAAIDEVPVEQHTGGVFMEHAWHVMRDIKAGDTGHLHRVRHAGRPPAGGPGGGRRLRPNAAALFVPCHRVLRTDGGLGGYRWGLDVKQWLLGHEGGARA